ncbi:MAG: hypothetical protein HS103_04595 [Anaerolineales bacterium]|nr:hypothetical protein [Anaerolineales bacterium]
MPRAGRRWIALSVLILLIAFAFRLWHLGTQSLWHDEAWSVFSSYTPTAPQGIRGSDPNAPPLFYSTVNLWMVATGDTVWGMRYWSLLLSLTAVAAVIGITRRWFGRSASLMAGALMAINPTLWVFSQEIRAYTAMSVFAVILLALLHPFTVPRQKALPPRTWAWLLLVEFIALYSHTLAVPLVAWLNLTAAIIFLWRRAWRRLALWIAVQALMGIAYLPWLLTQNRTGTPLNTPPAISPSLIGDIWASYFTGIKGLYPHESALSAAIIMFGVLALLVVIRGGRRGYSVRGLLVLSQVALLPVFQWAIIRVASIDFHPRYFILSLPATLILLALAARGWAGRGAVILTAAVISVLMTGAVYSTPIYQHDDFRAIAARYAHAEGDTALVIPYGWEPTLDYYGKHMGFRAPFLEIPLHSTLDRIMTGLREGLVGKRRAEFLTWFQLPADVRGAYPCFLGAVGEKTDELTVSGLRTETYRLDPNAPLEDVFAPLPVRDPRPVGETGIVLRGTKAIRGCLILLWGAGRDIDEDWRVSLRVRAPSGEEIQIGDADLLNDRQLPSALWRAGEGGATFIRYGGLDGELPAGTPFTILYRRADFAEGGRVEIFDYCSTLTGWAATSLLTGRTGVVRLPLDHHRLAHR